MHHALTALSVLASLVLSAAPALAGGQPGSGGLLPMPDWQARMQRQMMTPPPARTPYPRTYTEQVARSLGVYKDGVRLFASPGAARDPYAPSVSLGGGGMLRLRWNQ